MVLKKELIKKNNEKVLISGKALLSTMLTLSTMGKIGKNVLKQYEIEKIDEEELYSYRIRNEIHKAAKDRYGEIALTAIGFSHGENLFRTDVVEKVYTRIQHMFESKNIDQRHEALELLFKSWVLEGNKLIKEVNKANSYNFYQSYEKLSKTSFKVKSYSSWDSHQAFFFAGVTEYILIKFFSKYWKFKITINHREHQIIDGFCMLSVTYEFDYFLSNISEEHFLNKRVNEIKDQLLQSVLEESDEKNNQLEVISHQIGKYIPPQIHNALFEGKYDTQITTKRKKLTIFFSDIKNFTTTSEGLQPEDLTKYLNEYFSEMTSIALSYGATIDKYIGDAMMVFFGDPDTKGEKADARACVQMSLKMQEKMLELQQKWKNEGFANPFQIRMGMNTGYCNVGNFGSDQRLTYTIIGGEVNIAQRLEANADANGILMSYETYAFAQDMVEVEEREAIVMKGISREIKVFSIIKRKVIDQSKNNSLKKNPTKIEISQMNKLENKISKLEKNFFDLDKKIQKILKKL